MKEREEKEKRKPTKIGNNLVKYNNNTYKSYSPDEAGRRLDEWRQDPSLPIPVQEGTPQYKRIFEAVE